MNPYEAKQAARKARYEERASKATRQADAVHAQAHEMAQAIPFGQPILVGHHSEGADRRYRAKITRGFEKSFELQRTAEHYADKAASVGKGGISSDDPDAIEKLRARLARLQAVQEAMKKANAAIRHHRGDEAAQVAAIVEIEGFTEDQARQIIQPDYMNRVGFAPFTLHNNNANIHRIAARIKELEQAAGRTETTRSGPGYTYREDPQENRDMFLFDSKPAKETRDILKRHGFRWSPTRNAWVRQLTGTATWAAKDVIRYLDE